MPRYRSIGEDGKTEQYPSNDFDFHFGILRPKKISKHLIIMTGRRKIHSILAYIETR